jgi:hypothetical protein
MNIDMDVEKIHAKEKIEKITTPAFKMAPRPRRSAMRPIGNENAVFESMYPDIIQLVRAAALPNSWDIAGIAKFTALPVNVVTNEVMTVTQTVIRLSVKNPGFLVPSRCFAMYPTYLL